jgi:hypothetical protein
MAKYEAWIISQQKTVESDGTKSKTIVLEFEDKALATWETDNPNLIPEIEAMLELQADDMPKGQQILKFVSYDAKSQQLGSLSHAVHGRNVELKKSGSGEKAHAIATSVHLDNAATVQRALASENERLVKQCDELLDQKLDLTKSLIGLSTATMDFQRKIDREEKRSQMYSELMKTAEPLLQAAIAIGAEFGVMKIQDLIEKSKRAKDNEQKESDALKLQVAELVRQRDVLISKLEEVATEVNNGKSQPSAGPEPSARLQDAEPDNGAATVSDSGPTESQTNGRKRHARDGGNGAKGSRVRTSGKSKRKQARAGGKETIQT